MPIHEYQVAGARTAIGLAGEAPNSAIAAHLPGFELYQYDGASAGLPGRIDTTAAVVFRQSAAHPKRIGAQLREWAPTLLTQGCMVFVQPLPIIPGSGMQRFRKFVVDAIAQCQLPAYGLTADEANQVGLKAPNAQEPRLTPLVCVLTAENDWAGILLSLHLHPAGRVPSGDPQVTPFDADGQAFQLDAEQHTLVRRAFPDSALVRLHKLRNGLSGVDAYCAFVTPADSVAGGTWPYRYFVKIGPRDKVSTEYLAYRAVALEHLPYHLGPRLRLDRCALGHKAGILVSDFVDGAEPLRDSARDRRATGSIANLFNVTYRAWHNGTSQEHVALQSLIGKRLPEKVPDFRLPLIKALGASHDLRQLCRALVDGDSRPVVMGVIHGDLHATNVMVRGHDAILIDFERVENRGPILRDLACLEGGLFVDGFVGDRRGATEVLNSVRSLYSRAALNEGKAPIAHPSEGSAWFFEAAAQIRLHARQFECLPGQYALLLASELLRKACNKQCFDEGAACQSGLSSEGSDRHLLLGPVRMEHTRAIAYLLAEAILAPDKLALKPAAGDTA